MLKNIDPLLGPELLMHLSAMGHGDEVAIVDANFPATRCAQRLVRLEGVSATDALKSVMSVLPLDQYVEKPGSTMAVCEGDSFPEITNEFQDIITTAGEGENTNASIERFEFYRRVEQAYLVVSTGERRLYGNILLKKGVIK